MSLSFEEAENLVSTFQQAGGLLSEQLFSLLPMLGRFMAAAGPHATSILHRAITLDPLFHETLLAPSSHDQVPYSSLKHNLVLALAALYILSTSPPRPMPKVHHYNSCNFSLFWQIECCWLR